MFLLFNGREIARGIRRLNFWEKAAGLTDRRFGPAVYFRTRWGVHTFGLRHPIDVLVLSDQGKVGAFFKNLKPNKIRFWHPKFKHVFEFSDDSLNDVQNPPEGIFVWYDKGDE